MALVSLSCSALPERAVPNGRQYLLLYVRTPWAQQDVEVSGSRVVDFGVGALDAVEPHDPLSAEADPDDGSAESFEVVDVWINGASRGEMQEV
mgnify:FL=1